VILFVYGLMGIFSVLYLFGVYSILLIISFLLKKSKIRNRNILEYFLIFIYVISHTLYYLNWDVGSELYFNESKVPFVGNNQNFIIGFGIDGKVKLPNNTFTDNEIFIPENGILLTSSKTDSYKHRYRFEKEGSGNRFGTNYFEQCNCYGKANHKFNYVVGAINDSGTIDYKYENSILETICDKLNTGEIKSNLISGYKDGTYLEKTEIVINNKNLTSLPKGLLKLQNLEYINIHSNDLKTIPLEIYQFPKLKKFYIGFNNIVELPDKIGTLTTLESLAVNGNELTDLPDTLLTLPNLKYLSVRENKFSEETQLELYNKYKQKGIELQFK
jgi:Leucine-rich repeat (LRR) protein